MLKLTALNTFINIMLSINFETYVMVFVIGCKTAIFILLFFADEMMITSV